MIDLIFSRIWNIFIGYLVIKVDGLSLERFINLCISRGVKLWGINRTSYTSLTASIDIGDFKSLPPIVRRVDCRVKIIDKRGLPFILYRFRHRKMLAMGMLFFLIILYVLSSFIWVVQVEGVKKIDLEIIYSFLEEKNVKPGAYKGNLSPWQIENEILIKIPELSWASVEIKGIKAIVRVVEGVPPPKLVKKGSPCNIVAAKDGIIEELIVLEGEAVVEIGDTVRKGQLLVSGIIEHDDSQKLRYVHANSQVLARTWYEGQGEMNFQNVSKVRTGRVISQKQIETNKWEINFSNKEIPFADYEVETKEETILGFDSLLGFSMINKEYHELESISPKDKDRIMKKLAREKAVENAIKNIPREGKIIDKRFKYDIIKGKGYKVIVYIEILEDIAEQVELSAN